jgi:hypothetical protein
VFPDAGAIGFCSIIMVDLSLAAMPNPYQAIHLPEHEKATQPGAWEFGCEEDTLSS